MRGAPFAFTCAWLAGIALTQGAAAAAEPPAPSKHRPNVLRIAVSAEPENLDWNLAARAHDALYIKNLMDGLMELDEQGVPQPALAESYTLSADRRTYTFKLRKGVKWSDGKPLEANDFVESWRRLLAPLSYAPYAGYLVDVDGASEFRAGVLSSFDKVGARALDSGTFQVTLREPRAYFLHMLSLWVTYPIRMDLVRKYRKDWTLPAHMAVVGPYKLTQYDKGKLIVFRKNPLYYGQPGPLEEVRFSIVDNAGTAEALYKAGEVDVFSPSSRDSLEKEGIPAASIHPFELARTAYLGFDTNDFPFNLKKVRLAFAKAVDPAGLGAAMHGMAVPARSVLPEALARGITEPEQAYDPEAARKLLDEAGITNAETMKVEFAGVSSDENAYLMTYVQQQIKKNLSINLQVSLQPVAKFDQNFALHTGSVFLLSWNADYLDPYAMMSLFLSTSTTNKLDWKSEGAHDYERAVLKAAMLPDGPERRKLYTEALTVLQIEDVLVVPLHHSRGVVVVQPWVKGYVPTPPLGDVDFRAVRVD